MIEAVLFDLGDTLLHAKSSRPTYVLEAAVRSAYDRLTELDFNPPPFETYLRVMRRQFWRAYIRSKITRREIPAAKELQRGHSRLGITLDLQQVNDVCVRSMIPTVGSIFTVDQDAMDVVGQLHEAGFKLGLVSNTVLPGFTIDDFLEHQGFLQYFPVRIYSSEVRYMKPGRKIFRLALDRLGVPAERVMFVGDHVANDVKGPSRVGMQTILVVRGGRTPRGWARPDHTVHGLSEVPEILRNQRM